MPCSCLKNDFNLYVTQTDCRNMVVEDQSIWMPTEEGFFDSGDTLPLVVSAMSLGKAFELSLLVNKRNKYDSMDVIGMADTCIPDDIYCFSTTSCGKSYSINRAFLCSSYCKIEQLKAKAKEQKDWDFLRDLKSLAEQIESNAEFGKVETAIGLLEILNKKLKNVTCGSC